MSGLGCHPTPAILKPKATIASHPMLRAAMAAPLPSSCSLERFESPQSNQTSTSSCVGHGESEGIYVTRAACGAPLSFVPSQKGIYTGARMVQRAAGIAPGDDLAKYPMQDGGTGIWYAAQAIATCGVRPLLDPNDGTHSDCKPESVNSEETFEELLTEAETFITGEYSIGPTDPDMVTQVHACIASGVAVVIGVQVERAFDSWDPAAGPLDSYDGTTVRGGHCLVIVGYAMRADGSCVFRIKNSWGNWGDSGHLNATDKWLRQAAFDIFPVTLRTP